MTIDNFNGTRTIIQYTNFIIIGKSVFASSGALKTKPFYQFTLEDKIYLCAKRTFDSLMEMKELNSLLNFSIIKTEIGLMDEFEDKTKTLEEHFNTNKYETRKI